MATKITNSAFDIISKDECIERHTNDKHLFLSKKNLSKMYNMEGDRIKIVNPEETKINSRRKTRRIVLNDGKSREAKMRIKLRERLEQNILENQKSRNIKVKKEVYNEWTIFYINGDYSW